MQAWLRMVLASRRCVQVPMAATVYCQAIQMRVEDVLGFDMRQANCWQWRPDYEGLELGRMR